MRDIGGFHEQALLGKIARALDVSQGMGKEEIRQVEPGITVRTISFEKLAKELAADHQLFVMDKKGTPLRGRKISGSACFMLTDHLPMPKNSLKGIERLGRREDKSWTEDAVCIAVRPAHKQRTGSGETGFK